MLRSLPGSGGTSRGPIWLVGLVLVGLLWPPAAGLVHARADHDDLYVQLVRVQCQRPAGGAYVGDDVQLLVDGRLLASGRGLTYGDTVELLEQSRPIPFAKPEMTIDLVVTNRPNGSRLVASQRLYHNALSTYREVQTESGELIGTYEGIGAWYQVSVHVGTRSELARLRSRMVGPQPGEAAGPAPRIDPIDEPTARSAKSRIAASRLHVHTPPSPFSLTPSMPRASQSSTIDFCTDGRFVDSGSTSMSTPGALAGGSRTASGTWSIGRRDGSPVLALRYARTGNVATYDLQSVLSGSWRAGRTRYAVDWKQGACP